MMKSGSQGAKEASLHVSLLVLYSNVGHKITGYFSVATFTLRNRYPLVMYNQNITLSLFLSNLFYQGKIFIYNRAVESYKRSESI
jgi:hypothetical protein